MKYTVESTIPGFKITISVSSMPDELDDIIEIDPLVARLQPFIHNAFLKHEVTPKGYFCVDHELDYLYDCAIKAIEQYQDCPIVCREYDDYSEIVESKTFDLLDYCVALIEDERNWVKFDIPAVFSGYVGECLDLFAEKGEWQVGYYDCNSDKIYPLSDNDCAWPWSRIHEGLDNGILKPVLWFGLSDQEELSPPWAMPFDGQSFSWWSLNDDDELLDAFFETVECDWFDSFYASESIGGHIESIVTSCPIRLDENDTQDTVSNKIVKYMLEERDRCTALAGQGIETLAEDIRILMEQKAAITKKIDDLKRIISQVMQNDKVPEFKNESISIQLKPQLSIKVPRSSTSYVYELMKKHGFDCSVPSSVKRAELVRGMLANDGVLPDWLLGELSVEEETIVECKLIK